VILEAEKVKKSKKLLRLRVNTAGGERQIIAGIAEHYKPEELIGRNVIVVANLKPAKLMGNESNGMILAVENREGVLNVLETDGSVKPGTNVR
jgi:methionyl-tRNA synthetase